MTSGVSIHALNVVKANQKFEKDIAELEVIVTELALVIIDTVRITNLYICPTMGILALGIECAAIKRLNDLNNPKLNDLNNPKLNDLNNRSHEEWKKTAIKAEQYFLVITSIFTAGVATIFLSIGGASWIVHRTGSSGKLFILDRTPFLVTMGCIAASTSILHWKIFQNFPSIK